MLRAAGLAALIARTQTGHSLLIDRSGCWVGKGRADPPAAESRIIMLTTLRTKTAVATFAGLSIIGMLAGCASTSTGASSGSTSTSTSSTSSDNLSSDSTTYKDGTYSADGSYNSPGGRETISVTLTVKSSVVTAVSVKTVSADATAEQYEAQFESGISAAVVGKKLGTLSVSRVAGSSLTSQGFNSAVSTIRSDATS
jgi:hypothetical protein